MKVRLSIILLVLATLACGFAVPAQTIRHPDRAHFVPGHFSVNSDVSVIVEKPETMKHLRQIRWWK